MRRWRRTEGSSEGAAGSNTEFRCVATYYSRSPLTAMAAGATGAAGSAPGKKRHTAVLCNSHGEMAAVDFSKLAEAKAGSHATARRSSFRS